MDCVALKTARPHADRDVLATFWLAKYGGISYRQLMYDYEKTKEIAERAMLEFEPDAHSPTGAAHRHRPCARSDRLQAIAVARATACATTSPISISTANT